MKTNRENESVSGPATDPEYALNMHAARRRAQNRRQQNDDTTPSRQASRKGKAQVGVQPCSEHRTTFRANARPSRKAEIYTSSPRYQRCGRRPARSGRDGRERQQQQLRQSVTSNVQSDARQPTRQSAHRRGGRHGDDWVQARADRGWRRKSCGKGVAAAAATGDGGKSSSGRGSSNGGRR